MNLKRNCFYLYLVVMVWGLSACTTIEKKEWVAVGGSKAAGMVTLGIDLPAKFGVSEPSASWDIEQANAVADRLCKNWGFARTEFFEGKLPVQVICQQIPGGVSPCGQKSYRIMYQCVDSSR